MPASSPLLGACCSRQRATVNAANYLDQYIDKSVDPRQDFYHYAVGKWLKAHPIPAAERAWGIANVVQDETYQRVLAISKAAAADTKAAPGSSAQKIGDFWYAAMDSVTNAKQGVAPLAAEFARIAPPATCSRCSPRPRTCSTSAWTRSSARLSRRTR